MISTPEFKEIISKKDKSEISLGDCKNYYKLFHDLSEDERLKILGKENLNKMAAAYKVYWENALTHFCDNLKSPVELPIPGDIKFPKHRDYDLRKKWRERVPDGTSVEDCEAALYKILGIHISLPKKKRETL